MATPDIGLRQRGRVVGAVARHGDQAAAGLLSLDEVEFVLRRGLREEVVHAGFGGNGGGGERVVAGDHDGADAHVAQLRDAFLHAALDDVFEVHDAERAIAIGDDQRSAADARDAVRDLVEFGRKLPPSSLTNSAIASVAPFAKHAAVDIDAAHAGVRGERNEVRLVLRHFAATQAIFLFGQDDDASGPRVSRRRDWIVARRRPIPLR